MPAFEKSYDFTRALKLAIVAAIVFLFVWYAWRLLLLAFAGLLFAVILHTIIEWIETHTRLGPKLSWVAAVGGFCALIALAAWLIAPRAVSQGAEIADLIPKSFAQMEATLNQQEWGRYIVRLLDQFVSAPASGARLTGLAKGTMEFAADLIVIAVVGLYGALNPRQYIAGLLRLVPANRREAARDIGSDVVYTLRWWLLGQLVPMFVLGIATMIGLWLLDVPLAFTLGLFTGIMIFIPYVGALLATIPAVLVALKVGPMTALYVLIFFLCVHGVEGYLLTPFVQKRAVRLPPILTILSQLLMWMLTGLLGVAVATPLAAVGLALVKRLYLHQPIER